MTKLLLAECSYKAIKFSCMNYHYSKTVPTGKLVGFGVWENDVFIGCVLFSRGSSNTLMNRYGLRIEEGCELTRVALTAHKTPVTRIVSIAFKELKKNSPGLKVVVSFADSRQGHVGGIYKAGNWVYTGYMETTPDFMYKGKWYHQISINKMIKRGLFTREDSKKFPQRHGGYRLRYVYPLHDDMLPILNKIKKPYPKSLRDELESKASGSHPGENGAVPIITHQEQNG